MNAFNVLCNEDLFLYMQSFLNGYEGLIHYFYLDVSSNCNDFNLLEEALGGKNWKVVNKLYQYKQKKEEKYSLSNWKLHTCHARYPHYAYSLISTCKWIQTNMGDAFPNWKLYMDIAAGFGDYKLVEFMHEHRLEGCTTLAMNWAARNGHMDVLQFLHYHRNEGCTTDAMDWAATKGHLDIVRFLHTHRQEGCTSNAMNGAAGNGHLEIVKFLYENRDEGCPDTAINWASKNKQSPIIKFFLNGKTQDERIAKVMRWAKQNGHTQIVQYLSEKNCELRMKWTPENIL